MTVSLLVCLFSCVLHSFVLLLFLLLIVCDWQYFLTEVYLMVSCVERGVDHTNGPAEKKHSG